DGPNASSFFASPFIRLPDITADFGAAGIGGSSAPVLGSQPIGVPQDVPAVIAVAERNAACTNASYTCLTNSISPAMSRACQIAESVCNTVIDTLRSSPRGANVDTIIRFPDGTTVVLQGGPGGAVYIIPSPQGGTLPPGPMQ